MKKQPKDSTSAEVLEAIFPNEAGRPSIDWVLRYVRTGVVPYVRKVGRSYLFDVEAVRKALKAKGIIS